MPHDGALADLALAVQTRTQTQRDRALLPELFKGVCYHACLCVKDISLVYLETIYFLKYMCYI